MQTFEVDLDVTRETILKGRGYGLTSPIALALRETGFTVVTFTRHRVLLHEDNALWEHKFRGAFRRFQDNYWTGIPVAPLSGTLHFFNLQDIQQEIKSHILDLGEAAPYVGEPLPPSRH